MGKKEKTIVMKENKKELRKGLKEDIMQLFSDLFRKTGRVEERQATDNSAKERVYDREIAKFLPWAKVYGVKTKHSIYTKQEWFSFSCIIVLCLHILLLLISYLYSYVALQTTILYTNPILLIIAIVSPYLLWVYTTDLKFFAFHRRKRLLFLLCIINTFLTIGQPLYTLCSKFILNLVPKILKPNPILTTSKLLLLCQVLIGILYAAIWLSIVRVTELESLLLSPTLRRQLELWKWQHAKDTRLNHEYMYDSTGIKNLETGQPIRIKESDRYLHIFLNGQSGTGKTSTIFLNMIREDLDQKLKNQEMRQKALLQMIQDKKATLKGPLTEFEESAVIPMGETPKSYEKNKKELERIKKKYPDMGATIIAPNPDLIDSVIRMATARGIMVNVVDPVNRYQSRYPYAKDMFLNPFYMPFDLPEEERVIYIANASLVFSDVLIATNNAGEGDPYFTDISLAVSSNIASIVMLAKNIKHEQAYIEDIQECISNFPALQQYVQIVENHFGISVNVNPAGTGGKGSITYEQIKNEGRKAKRSAKGNPYYYQILFIKQELLGAGAEKMFDQARGLRNLVNKILQDPRIVSRLSAKESEHRLDFDRILSNNEITVVNTAISLGKSISTSFGLFFLLTHRVSVLRRPDNTRTFHSLMVDEASNYMHPFYEDCIVLYRQYKIACLLALQTSQQTEKNRSTAYLKQVFLGAGTQILFGRINPEEMKLYQEMGGVEEEQVEQKTITQNDILASNPNYTESERYTPSLKNQFEGADLRYLDFLELTIWTVDQGRVLKGQHGRVFFIGEDAFDKKHFTEIDWEKIVPEAFQEVDCIFTMYEEEWCEEDEQLKDPSILLVQTEEKKRIDYRKNTLAVEDIPLKNSQKDKNLQDMEEKPSADNETEIKTTKISDTDITEEATDMSLENLMKNFF